MKTFMEEYGLIVVAAIVIMIFVVIATPIGEGLRDNVLAVIKKLTAKLNSGLSVSAPSVSGI
ncbi:MAG: hypothetical protein ACI4KE_03010 [Anaerovoracaceae bacterium]